MSLPFFLLFLFSVICGIDAITTPSIDTSPQVLNYPGYTLSGGETGRFIVVFKPAESVATRVSLEAQIALASAVDILDFDLGNQLAFAANLTSAAFALLLSQSTVRRAAFFSLIYSPLFLYIHLNSPHVSLLAPSY